MVEGRSAIIDQGIWGESTRCFDVQRGENNEWAQGIQKQQQQTTPLLLRIVHGQTDCPPTTWKEWNACVGDAKCHLNAAVYSVANTCWSERQHFAETVIQMQGIDGR